MIFHFHGKVVVYFEDKANGQFFSARIRVNIQFFTNARLQFKVSLLVQKAFHSQQSVAQVYLKIIIEQLQKRSNYYRFQTSQ